MTPGQIVEEWLQTSTPPIHLSPLGYVMAYPTQLESLATLATRQRPPQVDTVPCIHGTPHRLLTPDTQVSPGMVALDCDGDAWQANLTGWTTTALPWAHTLEDILEGHGPLTIIHDPGRTDDH